MINLLHPSQPHTKSKAVLGKSLPAFTAIFLLISHLVTAQNKIDGFSINPKFGIYNIWAQNAGFVKGGEINILKNHIIYSLDYYKYDEPTLYDSPKPGEYYQQIGLMLGKYVGDRYFRFQYEGGIAAIRGLKRTNLIAKSKGFFGDDLYDSEKFFTAGLNLKMGFKVVPYQYWSVGLDLQANLNFERPVFMAMFSVEIGKLRGVIKQP